MIIQYLAVLLSIQLTIIAKASGLASLIITLAFPDCALYLVFYNMSKSLHVCF